MLVAFNFVFSPIPELQLEFQCSANVNINRLYSILGYTTTKKKPETIMSSMECTIRCNIHKTPENVQFKTGSAAFIAFFFVLPFFLIFFHSNSIAWIHIYQSFMFQRSFFVLNFLWNRLCNFESQLNTKEHAICFSIESHCLPLLFLGLFTIRIFVYWLNKSHNERCVNKHSSPVPLLIIGWTKLWEEINLQDAKCEVS